MFFVSICIVVECRYCSALCKYLLRDVHCLVKNDTFCLEVSRGLWKKYGDKRVIDTPITEVIFIIIAPL